MDYKKVHVVQYISPYIYQCDIDHEKIVASFKEKMVCDLLNAFPSMEYRKIKFELCKPTQSELRKWVEDFKCLDGRYWYMGDSVSREWLEKELSQKNYKISMNAYVEQADIVKGE